MHTKDAEAAGESATRLQPGRRLARGHGVHRRRGAAALELTEQGARIADAAGGVSDEAWANAASRATTKPSSRALVCQIAIINAFNRANVMVSGPQATTNPANSDDPPPHGTDQ